MMNSDLTFPVSVPAIRIEQPLGVFYVASLYAKLLLKVSYSAPAKATIKKGRTFYDIFGSQRTEKEERLKEIARYIDTVEAAFPNSIILGANYNQDGKFITDNEIRWRIESGTSEDTYRLIIPTEAKIASLIDGQHRLHAFPYSSRHSMPLLCAIYLDIPLPYHAYIFATINFNQKKVDRSLAYELFGFDIDEELPNVWAPETLAVYLVRILNSESESPFYNHIRLGVQDGIENDKNGNWQISMATVVDGILSLISSNPKKDRYFMHRKSIQGGRDRKNLTNQDKSPLRNMYVQGNDKGIYSILFNFFDASKELFWDKAPERSYIKKTVGVQALFDVLRILLQQGNDLHTFKRDLFTSKLKNAEQVDFSDNFFQASGTGRGRIKNAIGVCMGVIDLKTMRASDTDKLKYEKICSTSKD